MKKLFTILLITAMLPMAALAINKVQSKTSEPNPYKDLKFKPIKVEVPYYLVDTKTDQTQAAFTQIANLNDASFSLYARNSIMKYDPTSGIYVALVNFRANGTNNLLDGFLYLTYSTNQGQSWGTLNEVYKRNQYVPCYSSFAMVNPTESNDPTQFKYMIYSPYVKYKASDQTYPWAGAEYVYISADENEYFEYEGPDENNSTNQEWWWANTTSFEGDGAQNLYHAGAINPPDGGVMGYYGVGGLLTEDDGNWDVAISKIPPQWVAQKFRQADNPTTGSYAGPMSIDVDPQGNVYCAVNNMFVADIDARVPGVSVSTDNGDTWKDFETMPKSILNNYISVNGGDPNSSNVPLPGNFPYQQDAFVVTGIDEFSYFYRVLIWLDDQNYESHIVEANKKDGNWTMRKVADFQGIPYMMIESGSSTDTEFREFYDDSRIGNELQAAKTASGDEIVLKWVDYNANLEPIAINPAITVYINVRQQDDTWQEEARELDEVQPTDIYTSYRNLSENSWHVPINHTNDAFYNKLTHIPPVVASLEKIPLLCPQTKAISYNAQYVISARNSYPAICQQMVVDYPQNLVSTVINAKTGSAVNDSKENYSFTLENAFPNPAQNKVEIPYSLEYPSNIKIELFDGMGQVVDVIFQGAVDAGFHAINYNTSKLSTGVYYYKLTVAEKSLTKKLSVIK